MQFHTQLLICVDSFRAPSHASIPRAPPRTMRAQLNLRESMARAGSEHRARAASPPSSLLSAIPGDPRPPPGHWECSPKPNVPRHHRNSRPAQPSPTLRQTLLIIRPLDSSRSREKAPALCMVDFQECSPPGNIPTPL